MSEWTKTRINDLIKYQNTVTEIDLNDLFDLLDKIEKLEARVARYERALKLILAEPYGCQMCDSGKLRNPAKPHREECGFEKAREALAATKDGNG
jgi:hypothetical protein